MAMEPLATRYQDVLKKIHDARVSASSVGVTAPVLLAVSKTHPAEDVEALYHLGQRDFAENYVQELLEKASALRERGCTELRWHFIGHLQTNKVKALLPVIDVLHTVDSEKLARKVAQQWKALGRKGRLPVFLEVNIDQEPSKHGLRAEEVRGVAERISQEMPELLLMGLMCIPAAGSLDQTRAAFVRLRELEASLRPLTAGFLSMGMSGDYETAIQEGATHVRVGTALFGPRAPQQG